MGAAVAIVALLAPFGRRRVWIAGAGLAVAAFVLPLQFCFWLIVNHKYDSGHTGVIATRGR